MARAQSTGGEAVPAAKFAGDPLKAAWLPNEAIAKAWTQYVKDTTVTDATPPPAPTDLRVQGNELAWEAEADLESGLAGFVIERDGKFLANVPEQGKNPFGRPVFQGLQYSDTPTQPLVTMRFTDTKAERWQEARLPRHGREHRGAEVDAECGSRGGWFSVSSVIRLDLLLPTSRRTSSLPTRRSGPRQLARTDARRRAESSARSNPGRYRSCPRRSGPPDRLPSLATTG